MSSVLELIYRTQAVLSFETVNDRKEESVNGCSKLLLLRLLLDRIMGRINWQRSSEPKDTSESRLRA